MEVINELLNYDSLKIVQNPDWFSFSIDSLLLANFINVKRSTKIIDFCTGNAPIPLFLSNTPVEKIIGVELQKEIFELANKSVKINNLEDKITIINDDVKNITNSFSTDSFDLITCNPPYFKLHEKSNLNNDYHKSIARHEVNLTLNDVILSARKLLKNGGKLAIIHRTDRLVDIIHIMRKYNIEPKRLKFVYPFKNSESNLVLIEGSKNGKPGIKVESPIIVHNDDGSYSKEINFMFSGGRK